MRDKVAAMNTLAERVKLCMVGNRTLTGLARACGIRPPSVSAWLSGKTKKIEGANLLRAAAYLGVNPRWLASGDGPRSPASPIADKHYPRVVGSARCGNNGYYVDLDGGDGYLEIESAPGSHAIRIRGNSMFPAIKDGWFVIIEPDARPAVDEYLLVKFKDGRKMVKTLLYLRPDCLVLESVNGGERLTAMLDDLEGFSAVSAVVPPSKHREYMD